MYEHIRGFNYYIACAPDEPGAIEIEWKDEDSRKVSIHIKPVDFVDALRAYADAIERSNGEPRYTVWQQVPDDYTADAVETEASFRSGNLSKHYDRLGIKPRRFIEVDFVPKSTHVQISNLVTIKQAAAILGYDPGSVRKILERTPDRLRAHKMSGVWLLERESVEAYKRRRQANG